MISIEELHGRVLNRLDMTRDISDEELTELIYEILREVSKEEYLSLDRMSDLGRELLMPLGSWIFYRSFWKMRQ